MGNGHRPLSCRQVRRVLQAYLDDALDDVTTGRVAHHLQGCLRCGLEAEIYTGIKNALARRGRMAPAPAARRLREFGQALIDRARLERALLERSPSDGASRDGASRDGAGRNRARQHVPGPDASERGAPEQTSPKERSFGG